jgi:hypothetical protein
MPSFLKYAHKHCICTQQHCYDFPYVKPNTLAGFEPGSSVSESVHATPPRHAAEAASQHFSRQKLSEFFNTYLSLLLKRSFSYVRKKWNENPLM